MSDNAKASERQPEPQRSADKQAQQGGNNEAVRHEVDRLARQMGRMGDELKRLRDRL